MELPVVVGRPQPLTAQFQAANGSCEASGSSNSRGTSFTVTFKTQPTAGAQLSLVFRNFYAATLRVVQINSDGSSRALVDEFTLMQHVQYEDDAQKWHVLPLDQVGLAIFCTHDPSVQLDHIRVFCFQPCPLWASFELQEVKIFSQPMTSSGTDQQVLSPRQKPQEIVQTRPSCAGRVQQTALHLLTLLRDVRKLLHQPSPSPPSA